MKGTKCLLAWASRSMYLSLGLLVVGWLVGCAGSSLPPTEPIPGAAKIPLSEVVTTERLRVTVNERIAAHVVTNITTNPPTIMLAGLYNWYGGSGRDIVGRLQLALPAGYELAINGVAGEVLIINDPPGSAAMSGVFLGALTLAEGSLAAPVGGNSLTYLVYGDFQATPLPLVAGGITATVMTGDPPIFTNGAVEITERAIRVTGFMNALDSVSTTGRLTIGERENFILRAPPRLTENSSSLTLSFSDPAGREHVEQTLPESIMVTNTLTGEVLTYAVIIVFEANGALLGNDNIVVEFGAQGQGDFITAKIISTGALPRITVSNLYNVDSTDTLIGTITITNLAANFVTAVDGGAGNVLTFTNPPGRGATTVVVGQLTVAEGSLSAPVGGNVVIYEVVIAFTEAWEDITRTNVAAEWMVISNTNSDVTTYRAAPEDIEVTGTNINIRRFTNVFGPEVGIGKLTFRLPSVYSVDSVELNFDSSAPGFPKRVAHTLTLPAINVTNRATTVVVTYRVTIAFLESAVVYEPFNAADITLTFGRQSTRNGVDVVMTGTTIRITGITNANDAAGAHGDIRFSQRIYYYIAPARVNFADPVGLGASSTNLALAITNVWTQAVTQYNIEITFLQAVIQPNPNDIEVYLTEIFKRNAASTTIEIYVANIPGTAESVLVNKYRLRAYYVDNSGVRNEGISSLSARAINLYEGNFYQFVLANLYLGSACSLFELVEVVNAGEYRTVDFVTFGTGCTAADKSIRYASATYEERAVALDIPAAGGNLALTRSVNDGVDGFKLSAPNIFSDENWEVGTQTPLAPTDATCMLTNTADNDKDGILDCLEAPGNTYFGMPLHSWGARVGQVDLFLEIDYIACRSGGKVGSQPIRAAVEKMRAAFLAQDIHLHIDVGDLFDASQGTDAGDFDLGGGNDFLADGGSVNDYTNISLDPPGDRLYYSIKDMHARKTRKQFFYYMILALGNINSRVGGIAELGGNDSLVTIASTASSSRCQSPSNRVINEQANVMTHELGHNLGLKHGGSENTNFKPNYLSVMNYAYNGYAYASDRQKFVDAYYFNANRALGDRCSNFYRVNSSSAPIYHNPADFNIRFSDGSAANINENNLNEAADFLFPGLRVDYNCNGQTETRLAFDINFDGRRSVLRDFNDRGMMESIFSSQSGPFFAPVTLSTVVSALSVGDEGRNEGRSGDGVLYRQPLGSDRQPTIRGMEEFDFGFAQEWRFVEAEHGHEHDHDHARSKNRGEGVEADEHTEEQQTFLHKVSQVAKKWLASLVWVKNLIHKLGF